MIINSTTFDLLLRKRGFTQAEVARRARLGVKTVGRIRQGLELRAANAEKIASVLGVDVEELQLPPSEKLEEDVGKKGGLSRFVADVSASTLNVLTLASLRYNLPEKTILEAGPYMFMILAELSLQKRREKLEGWKTAALAAAEEAPCLQWPTIDDIRDNIWDFYYNELASIEERDLSGGFAGEHPNHPTRENPGHAFFSFLGDLSNEGGSDVDYGCIDGTEEYKPLSYDLVWDILIDFFRSDNEREIWMESPDVEIATGLIPLREMPEELLRSGSGLDRRAWVSNHPVYQKYVGDHFPSEDCEGEPDA